MYTLVLKECDKLFLKSSVNFSLVVCRMARLETERHTIIKFTNTSLNTNKSKRSNERDIFLPCLHEPMKWKGCPHPDLLEPWISSNIVVSTTFCKRNREELFDTARSITLWHAYCRQQELPTSVTVVILTVGVIIITSLEEMTILIMYTKKMIEVCEHMCVYVRKVRSTKMFKKLPCSLPIFLKHTALWENKASSTLHALCREMRKHNF